MAADDFETLLKKDLRGRGYAKEKSGSGEQPLFARWLTPEEMRPAPENREIWEHKGGLLLGRRDGRLIGWNDDRHVFTVAGNRSGKGVSLIVPNLLLYEGSALVIDPKGELAAMTAGRRGQGAGNGTGPGLGQDVHVLDPFGLSGCKAASFNPLDELDLKHPDVIDDAAMFAEALIMTPPRGDPHWTESAQAVLTGLILMVLNFEKEERNLLTVRRLLTLAHPSVTRAAFKTEGDKQKALAELLVQEGATNPKGHICEAIGEQMRSMGDNSRELSSVLSTARTQTQWLDSEKVKGVLSHSDFKLENLKLKKTTIYLCLPATRMATHARWFRLMISLALTVMERTQVEAKPRVLFVLEEFPVLGHMKSLESAAGQMAGFGVKLWTIIQNVGQLQQHYDKSWETFLANSGVVTAFGNSDSTTLEILSKRLGRTQVGVQTPTGVAGAQVREGRAAFEEKRHDVPLLAEHEIQLAFARQKNRALIITMDREPAVVERIIYHDKNETMFKGLYDPDPTRREETASEA